MPSSVSDRGLRVLPARFRDRTLDDYQATTPSQQRALAEARRCVAGEIRSLVLIGAAGVGKTHLAAAIASGIYERGEPIRTAQRAEYEAEWNRRLASSEPWTRFDLSYPASPTIEWQNVADLTGGLRMDMDRDREDRRWAERLQEDLRPTALLILDDLGREKISDWTGELVYALINGRYEDGLGTIATSNLTPAELQASGYWTAISRLAEDGALVEISGPDRRLRR